MGRLDLDDAPELAADVFARLPEPEWHKCSCGVLSARVPCFDCKMKSDREADERRTFVAGLRTIPNEFMWAELSSHWLGERVDSKRRPLAEVVKRILGSDRVVLAGGSGTGKTSLAIACLRERLTVGARFVSAIDLAVARIQHAAGDGEAGLVLAAMMAPLIVLDDLGEEQHTATSAIRDVIRVRHSAGRATWVTTGLRSKEIVAKYGDGVRRRLFDGAYAEWLGPVPKDVKP